jgi:hypothetical protein
MALHAPMLLTTSAQPRASSGRRVAALSFEVNVLPSAVASVEPAPEPLSPPVVKRSQRSVPAVAPSAPATPAAGVVEPLPDPESVAEPASPAPAPGSVQRDLSPLAAARSLPLTAAEGRVAAARPNAEPDAHVEARLAEGIPGLVRDKRVSDRSVGELAQDAQAAVLRPWDLVLQPLERARYRYRGEGFDAVIAADGGVKYRDKDGLRLSLSTRLVLEEPRRKGSRNGKSPNVPVFSLDLGDPKHWVDSITGNDPHASERRTFLERTRALREYLRDQTDRSARETRDGPPLIE